MDAARCLGPGALYQPWLRGLRGSSEGGEVTGRLGADRVGCGSPRRGAIGSASRVFRIGIDSGPIGIAGIVVLLAGSDAAAMYVRAASMHASSLRSRSWDSCVSVVTSPRIAAEA